MSLSKMIKVPIDMLDSCDGVVAKEVVAPDGVVMLPMGVDISLFEASISLLIKKMRGYGIEYIYINPPQQLSEDDIEEILQKVYSDDDLLIDKQKARDVVKHVDNVFNNIRAEDDIRPEMLDALTNMGSSLTEDLLRNPSVTLSLGQVKAADEYTFVHSFNVAVLTGYLANKLRPGDEKYLHKMVLGGLMHDLGKAKIPLDILNKPAPLSKDEFAQMRRHPEIGVSLAMKSGVQDRDILGIIGGHHEKWGGKGYPNRRKGKDIPEVARVAAVADVFDALTARRVYKSAMPSRDAVTLILNDAGTHFDPKVARAMLVSLGLYPPGSIVSLSDGRVGVVISGGGKDLVRPVVMLVDPKGKKDAGGVPNFIDLKNEKSLCITSYLGQGDKRELGV
ncbi:MAG: HD-GYP domain-containing protein [Synergistaceae bacterium]|jgi:HD-GYP domain-containing protein (c-di-GMP phosphodiesterase class II)|nr:HD-GYP domain-containing protein [Synergistaceae bacterium]